MHLGRAQSATAAAFAPDMATVGRAHQEARMKVDVRWIDIRPALLAWLGG